MRSLGQLGSDLSALSTRPESYAVDDVLAVSGTENVEAVRW